MWAKCYRFKISFLGTSCRKRSKKYIRGNRAEKCWNRVCVRERQRKEKKKSWNNQWFGLLKIVLSILYSGTKMRNALSWNELTFEVPINRPSWCHRWNQYLTLNYLTLKQIPDKNTTDWAVHREITLVSTSIRYNIRTTVYILEIILPVSPNPGEPE